MTKRKPNPRPRKYASASERQAAYRARAPEVCFRAEEKTAQTLDRIAADLDVSRADLLLSMTKFALTNHDWARFGLTHKPLPFGYGTQDETRKDNPVKMTKRQEVIEFGKRMGFKASAGKGYVYLTNMVGWGETFDDWDKAHAYVLKAYDDHYVHRTPYPWDYKENPAMKFTQAQIDKLREEWKRIKGIDPDSPNYAALLDYLDKLPQSMLMQLAEASPRIPFVSGLALNRVKRKTNPMKTTTKRKPTPAQLAARERFAEMARSGAFKKAGAGGRRANPVGNLANLKKRYQTLLLTMADLRDDMKRRKKGLPDDDFMQGYSDAEVSALLTKYQAKAQDLREAIAMYEGQRKTNPAKPAKKTHVWRITVFDDDGRPAKVTTDSEQQGALLYAKSKADANMAGEIHYILPKSERLEFWFDGSGIHPAGSSGNRPIYTTRRAALRTNPAKPAASRRGNPIGEKFANLPEPVWISKDKGVLLSPHYIGPGEYELRPVVTDRYEPSAASAKNLAEWAADEFRRRGYPTVVYVLYGVTSSSKGKGRKRTGFTVTTSPGGYSIAYALR